MRIEKAMETDRGTITFQGELSQEEFDLVLTIGLTELILHGYLGVTAPAEDETVQ